MQTTPLAIAFLLATMSTGSLPSPQVELRPIVVFETEKGVSGTSRGQELSNGTFALRYDESEDRQH